MARLMALFCGLIVSAGLFADEGAPRAHGKEINAFQATFARPPVLEERVVPHPVASDAFVQLQSMLSK